MSLAESIRTEAPSTDELRQLVETSANPVTAAEKDDPRDKEVWSFHLDWTDARGKRWDANFTNHILSMGQQQQVSAFKSRCMGGVPWDSVEPQMRLINSAVAHMEFSLEAGDDKRPDWARDLRSIKDPALVLALWDQVTSHEGRFFRLDPPEEEGREER